MPCPLELLPRCQQTEDAENGTYAGLWATWRCRLHVLSPCGHSLNASMGCSKGSIRKASRRTNKNKTQKHLAPKMSLGRKQLQAEPELAGTAPHWPQWVWGGDDRGQALRLHPQPGIDP